MTLHPPSALLALCLSLTFLSACGGGTTSPVDNPPAANAQQTPPSGSVQTPAPTVPADDWVLDWSDEFNGNSLDSAVWTADLGSGGWGNSESQYYKAQNAVVAGGLLTITAKRETAGDAPYTSARIQTSRKQSFTYGRFEMRAKLPATQGMWPAFWLLGNSCNSWGLYGGTVNWPHAARSTSWK